MHWSENPKLWQSHKEKSAFYFDIHISLHEVYLWAKESKQSVASLIDCTDHKAAAVITNLNNILSSLASQGKAKINIISDSPLCQYRNKKIFWLMLQFLEEFNWMDSMDLFGKVLQIEMTVMNLIIK